MGTNGKIADDVVEAAANSLVAKIEKRHQKHINEEQKYRMHQQPGYIKLPTECHCKKEKLEIEEGKKSPVVKSPITDRRTMRRNGVAETSEVEGKLVKEALEVMLRASNLTEYQPS